MKITEYRINIVLIEIFTIPCTVKSLEVFTAKDKAFLSNKLYRFV